MTVSMDPTTLLKQLEDANIQDHFKIYQELNKFLKDEKRPSVIQEVYLNIPSWITVVFHDIQNASNHQQEEGLSFLGLLLSNRKSDQSLDEVTMAKVMEVLLSAAVVGDKNINMKAMQCLSQANIPEKILLEKVGEFLSIIETNLNSPINDSLVQYEACLLLQRSLSSYPKIMVSGAGRLVRLIFTPICNPHNNIREIAMKTLESSLPLLLQHQDAVVPSLISLMKMSLLKNMLNLFNNKEEHFVLKVWGFLVTVLGKALHKGTTLINCLLEIVEKGFKSPDVEVHIAAFTAWQYLIDNFSKDIEILSNPKRLRLLLQPLKMSIEKSEGAVLKKTMVWWHLVWSLNDKLSSNLEQACIPLLQFTLASDLKDPGGSHPSPRTGSPLDSSHIGPKLESLQKKGCELLARLLEHPKLSSPLSNISPKKLPNLSIYPLKTPLPSAMFTLHAKELIQAVRVAINILGKCGKSVNLIQYILQLLVSNIASVQEDGSKGSIEAVTNFLHLVHAIVKEELCIPSIALKVLDEGSMLPKRMLISHYYNIGTEGIMHGIPAFTLLSLLLDPSLLPFASSINSSYLRTFSHLITAGIQGSPSYLSFTQSVIGILSLPHVIAALQSEILINMWHVVSSQLTEAVEKTQEVNQGDSLEHDFSCLLLVLSFPLQHAIGVPQRLVKQTLKLWTDLYKLFARCAALVTTAEANSACEGICQTLTTELTSEHFKNEDFLGLLCNLMQVIVEGIDFTSLGKSADNIGSPIRWAKRRQQPLENLSTFVILLGKIISAVHFCKEEDEDIKRKKPESYKNKQVLNSSAILLLEIVNTLTISITVPRFLPPLISQLASPLSNFYSMIKKYPIKAYGTNFIQKLEQLWTSIINALQFRYTGPYDSDLLISLSPLLEVTLLQTRQNLHEKTRQFWYSTFGHNVANLTFPPTLKTVLKKVKPSLIPGLQINDEEQYSSLLSHDSENAISSPPIFLLPQVISNSETEKPFIKSPSKKKQVVLSKQLPQGRKTLPDISNLDELPEKEFVKIGSTPATKIVLTEHQKETRGVKSYIPAMYNDLSQSTQEISSVDESCNSTPASISIAETETPVENTSQDRNKESEKEIKNGKEAENKADANYSNSSKNESVEVVSSLSADMPSIAVDLEVIVIDNSNVETSLAKTSTCIGEESISENDTVNCKNHETEPKALNSDITSFINVSQTVEESISSLASNCTPNTMLSGNTEVYSKANKATTLEINKLNVDEIKVHDDKAYIDETQEVELRSSSCKEGNSVGVHIPGTKTPPKLSYQLQLNKSSCDAIIEFGEDDDIIPSSQSSLDSYESLQSKKIDQNPMKSFPSDQAIDHKKATDEFQKIVSPKHSLLSNFNSDNSVCKVNNETNVTSPVGKLPCTSTKSISLQLHSNTVCVAEELINRNNCIDETLVKSNETDYSKMQNERNNEDMHENLLGKNNQVTNSKNSSLDDASILINEMNKPSTEDKIPCSYQLSTPLTQDIFSKSPSVSVSEELQNGYLPCDEPSTKSKELGNCVQNKESQNSELNNNKTFDSSVKNSHSNDDRNFSDYQIQHSLELGYSFNTNTQSTEHKPDKVHTDKQVLSADISNTKNDNTLISDSKFNNIPDLLLDAWAQGTLENGKDLEQESSNDSMTSSQKQKKRKRRRSVFGNKKQSRVSIVCKSQGVTSKKNKKHHDSCSLKSSSESNKEAKVKEINSLIKDSKKRGKFTKVKLRLNKKLVKKNMHSSKKKKHDKHIKKASLTSGTKLKVKKSKLSNCSSKNTIKLYPSNISEPSKSDVIFSKQPPTVGVDKTSDNSTNNLKINILKRFTDLSIHSKLIHRKKKNKSSLKEKLMSSIQNKTISEKSKQGTTTKKLKCLQSNDAFDGINIFKTMSEDSCIFKVDDEISFFTKKENSFETYSDKSEVFPHVKGKGVTKSKLSSILGEKVDLKSASAGKNKSILSCHDKEEKNKTNQDQTSEIKKTSQISSANTSSLVDCSPINKSGKQRGKKLKTFFHSEGSVTKNSPSDYNSNDVPRKKKDNEPGSQNSLLTNVDVSEHSIVYVKSALTRAQKRKAIKSKITLPISTRLRSKSASVNNKAVELKKCRGLKIKSSKNSQKVKSAPTKDRISQGAKQEIFLDHEKCENSETFSQVWKCLTETENNSIVNPTESSKNSPTKIQNVHKDSVESVPLEKLKQKEVNTSNDADSSAKKSNCKDEKENCIGEVSSRKQFTKKQNSKSSLNDSHSKKSVIPLSPLSRSQKMLQAAIRNVTPPQLRSSWKRGHTSTNSSQVLKSFGSKSSSGTPNHSPPRWMKYAYSPSASPSASILKKRRLSGDHSRDSRDSTSPLNKQRKVSFAEPPVQGEILIESSRRSSSRSDVSRCLDMDNSKKKTIIPTRRSKRKKLIDSLTDENISPTKKQKESEQGLELISPSSPSPLSSFQPSSEGYQSSDCTEYSHTPLCSELIGCDDPIDVLLPHLTSSMWVRGLGHLVHARNIKTVGDLGALTPPDLKSLPIRSPKIKTVAKVLQDHLSTWKKHQSNDEETINELNKDCDNETVNISQNDFIRIESVSECDKDKTDNVKTSLNDILNVENQMSIIASLQSSKACTSSKDLWKENNKEVEPIIEQALVEVVSEQFQFETMQKNNSVETFVHLPQVKLGETHKNSILSDKSRLQHNSFIEQEKNQNIPDKIALLEENELDDLEEHEEIVSGSVLQIIKKLDVDISNESSVLSPLKVPNLMMPFVEECGIDSFMPRFIDSKEKLNSTDEVVEDIVSKVVCNIETDCSKDGSLQQSGDKSNSNIGNERQLESIIEFKEHTENDAESLRQSENVPIEFQEADISEEANNNLIANSDLSFHSGEEIHSFPNKGNERQLESVIASKGHPENEAESVKQSENVPTEFQEADTSEEANNNDLIANREEIHSFSNNESEEQSVTVESKLVWEDLSSEEIEWDIHSDYCTEETEPMDTRFDTVDNKEYESHLELVSKGISSEEIDCSGNIQDSKEYLLSSSVDEISSSVNDSDCSHAVINSTCNETLVGESDLRPQNDNIHEQCSKAVGSISERNESHSESELNCLRSHFTDETLGRISLLELFDMVHKLTGVIKAKGKAVETILGNLENSDAM